MSNEPLADESASDDRQRAPGIGEVSMRITVEQRPKPASAQMIRNEYGGIFMIELLVSVIVASIMGTAIVNTMSGALRVSSKAQSQVLATCIAQQVIDACRNRNFNDLITPTAAGGCMGTGQRLTVNNSGASSTSPVFPRSLMLELNDPNTVWNSESKENAFVGTVVADIAPIDADNASVNVTVSWNEHGGLRQFTTSTVITRFGLRSN